MIIQIILSIGLLGCLFYVISMGKSYRSIRLVLFSVILTGLVFVCIPSIPNAIARMVGVGRGADLIMYIWIVLNLLFILRLHVKLREQSESLTQLARLIALNNAAQSLPQKPIIPV